MGSWMQWTGLPELCEPALWLREPLPSLLGLGWGCSRKQASFLRSARLHRVDALGLFAAMWASFQRGLSSAFSSAPANEEFTTGPPTVQAPGPGSHGGRDPAFVAPWPEYRPTGPSARCSHGLDLQPP